MLQVKYLDSVKILSADFDALIKSIGKACTRIRNDYEMQHNAEVGLFTRPSIIK